MENRIIEPTQVTAIVIIDNNIGDIVEKQTEFGIVNNLKVGSKFTISNKFHPLFIFG